MIRTFREATYDIDISNPDHVSKGIKQIFVNGTPLEGNLVPLLAKGKVHQIKVVMG
ncbi:MAG: hypothetical protein WBN11_01825 [Eudoraea sp.]|uniref:hypothetical protein n=1 Tax=Eudoraea sp. TaxID=1979955 RepID=UPI003C788AF5